MGLGRFHGGVSVTRHLVAQGWDVTVTDLQDAEALADSVVALDGLAVTLALGAHDERDFTETDLVVVNPAVKPGNRYVEAARAAGVTLDTEIGMFLRACVARVIGVTGTAGKSTTTALLAECLRSGLEGKSVHLGGNIGRSLLPDLPGIAAGDLVVLELSSFQLHWLRQAGWRPPAAVLTNITPNHLDWHGDMRSYVVDKRGILPAADGHLVACADDEVACEVARSAECTITWISRDELDETVFEHSVFWREGALIARGDGIEIEVLRREDVPLLGGHAEWNVAAAVAAALHEGAATDGIREAVRGFDGLPHRLCPIGEFGGVLCVDDSKSTTPEAAALALAAFDRPVWLLAGGYDKGVDSGPMVRAANGGGTTDAAGVVCFGTTRDALAAALRAASGGATIEVVETLRDAVSAAAKHVSPGDVLLLSPGHASWDQFENYEQRGRVFADSVRAVHFEP